MPSAIGENIDAFAQEILLQRLSHQRRQPIDDLAIINRIDKYKGGEIGKSGDIMASTPRHQATGTTGLG